MISVETTPGILGRGIKENGRENSNMIYLKHCKNVPHPTQQ
jgi:hypothetical protein